MKNNVFLILGAFLLIAIDIAQSQQPVNNASLQACGLNCAAQYKFSPPPPAALNQTACGAFSHSVGAACAGDYCQAINGDCYGNLCVSAHGNCYGMGCFAQNGKIYPLQYPSWCSHPPGNDYAECLIQCKLLAP